jgi:hypothetical protein
MVNMVEMLRRASVDATAVQKDLEEILEAGNDEGSTEEPSDNMGY